MRRFCNLWDNSKVILCCLSAINTKGFWLNCIFRDGCCDHFYNGNKLLNVRTSHIDVCRLQALRLQQVYPSGNISTFLASLCSFLEPRIITGQDEHRFKLSTIRPHLCLTAINSSQFPTCTLTSPILTQCCWSKQNRYPRALCPTSLPCLGFGKLGETSSLTKDKLLGVLQIRLEVISFSIIGNFTCFSCSIFDIFSPTLNHRSIQWKMTMDKACSHRFKIYIQNLAEGGALEELSWPRIWEAKKQHNHFLPTTGHNNFLEKITDSSQTSAVELKPFFPCSIPKKCPICFPQKDFQQLASHLNMKKKVLCLYLECVWFHLSTTWLGFCLPDCIYDHTTIFLQRWTIIHSYLNLSGDKQNRVPEVNQYLYSVSHLSVKALQCICLTVALQRGQARQGLPWLGTNTCKTPS